MKALRAIQAICLSFLAAVPLSCHGESAQPSQGSNVDLSTQYVMSDGTLFNSSGTMTFSSGSWSGTIQIGFSGSAYDGYTVQVVVTDESGNAVTAGTGTVSGGGATVNASVSQSSLNSTLDNSDDWFFKIQMICDGTTRELSSQKVHKG